MNAIYILLIIAICLVIFWRIVAGGRKAAEGNKRIYDRYNYPKK